MRAARREWLVLAGPSQGRAQYAHHRSTSRPSDERVEPGSTWLNLAQLGSTCLSSFCAGRRSGQVIERGIELRLRHLRLFLGARLPRLFVLALFQLAHVLGPQLAFSIAHEPLYTQPCFRSWKCCRRTSARIRGQTVPPATRRPFRQHPSARLCQPRGDQRRRRCAPAPLARAQRAGAGR